MCTVTSLNWCTFILLNLQLVSLMRQFYLHQHEKHSKGGIYMLQGGTLLKPNWHQSSCVSVLSKVLHLIWRPYIIVVNLSLSPYCQTLQCHAQSYCTALASSLIARVSMSQPVSKVMWIWAVKYSYRCFSFGEEGKHSDRPLENWDWIVSFSSQVSFWLSYFLIDHLQIF